MAKKQGKRNKCTYCPADATTRDHVPPQCLFAKPLPSDLITVPCCQVCNQRASKDDEYFRTTLAMRDDLFDLPEVNSLAESALRSFARPAQQGLARKLLQTARPIERYSNGGLYLGRGVSYTVENTRLTSVVSRTIKGLFFARSGKRLPINYECVAYIEEGLSNINQPTRAQLKKICDITQSTAPNIIGGEVFQYWWKAAENDPCTTFWVLLFFGRVGFIGMTAPRDRLPRSKRTKTAQANNL